MYSITVNDILSECHFTCPSGKELINYAYKQLPRTRYGPASNVFFVSLEFQSSEMCVHLKAFCMQMHFLSTIAYFN